MVSGSLSIGHTWGADSVGRSPEQDLVNGFANEGLLTIALLLLVARGVRLSGVLSRIAALILGGTSGLRTAVTRMVLPVAASSSVMNNTPVVAMALPEVQSFAKTRGFSPRNCSCRLALPAFLVAR